MQIPQQQVTIDQLPDDQLKVAGWEQYRALEGARRQAQACEQNIVAISQELDKRVLARQERAGKEVAEKRTEQDALVDKLMARIAERNSLPSPNGTPEAKETKAE